MNITEREFTQLVQEQKSTIYTVCYMFARDKDEAADLFQDVLINLWKGIGKFRNDSEISTWVYRVSLNTCISADRKKRKMPTTRLDMNIDLFDLFDDDDTDSRQIQVLRQRIQRLQPLDRAIVLLWLESLSYQEIADIVGLTPKNISVRLTRIRLQLKQMKD